MYLIGNSQTVTGQDGMWREIVQIFHEHDRIGPNLHLRCQNHPQTIAAISNPADFETHACDGGCSLPCNARLDCGHVCPKKCHPGGHVGIKCVQPCCRTPPGCPFQHVCSKLCHQNCGTCTEKVAGILLPCGHLNTLICSQAAAPEQSRSSVKFS